MIQQLEEIESLIKPARACVEKHLNLEMRGLVWFG
jgi:hypothetical protein